MSDSKSSEDEFWQFAVELYGRPAVAAQMLDWQDRRGANVNLALLCLWTAAHGRRLGSADCARAFAAAAGWHAAAVEPLRAVRRRLKADWAGLAVDAEPARGAVMAAELAAERTEQALMLAALGPCSSGAPAGPNPELARANLLAYLGSAAAVEIDALLAAIG